MKIILFIVELNFMTNFYLNRRLKDFERDCKNLFKPFNYYQTAESADKTWQRIVNDIDPGKGRLNAGDIGHLLRAIKFCNN